MSMWDREKPDSVPTQPSGQPAPEALPKEYKEFEELVMNVLSARQQFFGQFFDPRRDYYKECGYPSHGKEQGSQDQYQELFDRGAIPGRVVEVLPEQTWQIQPTVYEDEDPEKQTPFEAAWDALSRTVSSYGKSWFQTEAGSLVWEYMRRVDVLSGLGQYGVLLLGLNDTVEGYGPENPVQPSPNNKLLFIRCFPERLAQISRLESDPLSPRFGQPLEYRITFNDPRHQYQSTVTGGGSVTREVHWSRVIHVADNRGSSEVYGTPRMRPVLNRLLDLEKLYGGSAEMYWRGAFPGISFETHPTLGAEAVKIDRVSMKTEMENYMNGLQRFMALTGLTAKSLAPQVIDPSPQIRVQLEAICIKLGIPMRIFMGSERGQLASGQDDATWNDKLRERQRNYVTPWIIVPFVDRLIHLGVLPEPKGFSVWWPDLTSQTNTEKSQIAFQRTQAIAQFVSSGAQSMITPLDYLIGILGLDEDEAVSIVANAMAARKTTEGLPPTPNVPPAPQVQMGATS